MAERVEGGRFAPGNKVAQGHGRKRRATEEEYLNALNACVSIADWKKAVKAQLDKAMDGDEKAFCILANYLIGKPTEYVAADLTSDGKGFDELIGRARDELQRRLGTEPEPAAAPGVSEQPE